VPLPRGASLKNCHDSILLTEWRCFAPVGSLIELDAPGEGPRGQETSHHPAVLEPVLDGVCVVWAGLLNKPLEVVHRWPRQEFVAVRDSRDLSHAGATSLSAAVVAMAGHGRGPLRALLAPLVAAFDAVLSTVSGDIG
jgi:hypothetical protein